MIAGLLVGYAVIVRTEGAVMLAVLPLFLLLRGWAWKTLRGWLVAIVFAVASLVPVARYADWFHERHRALQHDHVHGLLPVGPGVLVRRLRADQADRHRGVGLPDRAARRPDPAGQLRLARAAGARRT